ncbi:hypothetical protein Q5O14_13640 [Eubacteriaceae bacterium ES2]|nr:hypothetical protein Q5O14_13640 [Eubacteriaceae bacterium ES2]
MKFILNMVKKLKPSLRQNKGYALPLVLVLLALIISAAAFLLVNQLAEFDMNAKSKGYEICLLTAKNAMEIVKSEIESGNDVIIAENQTDPNGGSYSYHITKTGINRFDGEVSSSYADYQKQFSVNILTAEEASGDITDFYWKMEF